MITITCPVCDRPNIEGNICPNCETDLSSVRILVELPAITEEKVTPFSSKPFLPIGLSITLAILLLAVGIGLGLAGNRLLMSQNPSISNVNVAATPSPVISPQQMQQETTLTADCNGFDYRVRSGDSLSLIAYRFYGNGKLWNPLVQANPVLKNQENSLEVGDHICIPNIAEDLYGDF